MNNFSKNDIITKSKINYCDDMIVIDKKNCGYITQQTIDEEEKLLFKKKEEIEKVSVEGKREKANTGIMIKGIKGENEKGKGEGEGRENKEGEGEVKDEGKEKGKEVGKGEGKGEGEGERDEYVRLSDSSVLLSEWLPMSRAYAWNVPLTVLSALSRRIEGTESVTIL